MPRRPIMTLLVAVLATLGTDAVAADTRLYEMRVYEAAAGKLEALHARFRDHTVGLFAKHGMTNVGYFVPEGDNPRRRLVYFLAFPDRAAREASFQAFLSDPAWQAARDASEREGKIVERIESTLLATTDYAPELVLPQAKGPRVFELRTYRAPPGRLPALNARFRDHTLGLFAKHGMTNVVYWNAAPGEPAADILLVYLLAHASPAAAKASFGAFRQDPDWIAARTASEQRAGGSLTEATGGVVSEFLVPTDYSPLR